ncbi:hypothetical protein TNCV_3443791 [Trichonephila clavipes]|nr:hypothetical protein TNCV_3443791 [Trichonephila clavipes]
MQSFASTTGSAQPTLQKLDPVHRYGIENLLGSTVQQGFRYRVLLATKSRRNHRQRASGQRGKVGDDASAASGSAISDMKRVIMHHIFNIWQESWSQQLITNCTCETCHRSMACDANAKN